MQKYFALFAVVLLAGCTANVNKTAGSCDAGLVREAVHRDLCEATLPNSAPACSKRPYQSIQELIKGNAVEAYLDVTTKAVLAKRGC